IALWGHKGSNGRSRVYAATKFFLYTQIAGLVMLIGILGLVVYGYMMTGMIGFDYNYLLAVANRLPAGFAY
ncbi:MAG TPA: NADH-quinone oxidoreductase subunit M, partial [Acinetobacter nosocomialis]|nr:NADH-quinone oxidoreductase subunit M [Acinetobacter nosocomialis]